ncbi:MAG: N-acetylmuramoyl-L-alanine amidase, partial [Candidatus Omnitrophota bacterium]
KLFRKTYPERQAVLRESPIKKIVIDPGHGGNDPGAIGRSGLKEKYVNLDIAKRLSSLLRADGLQVVMTRTADSTVSLQRRMEITNNARADLFISIHSNANRVRSMNGFEVYCLSSAVSDSKRAINSAQSDALYIEKDSFASGPSLNLKAILWDMIYTSNRADSLRLASYICRSADRDLSSRVKGTKSGPYYVLKGAHMPTILIEVGFLSNRDEERRLKNGYYRQQLAEAIDRGITNYIKDSSLTEFAQR